MFLEKKSYSEAQENFKKALKANPKFAPAWKAFGIILFDANKVESALKYFQQALSIDDTDVETKIHIANCHYELQHHEAAIEAYLDILKVEDSADV
mmetsp:Transcript_35253/g.31700  ORF Transcript_35253/g.31700 Transcript_35253/m.31700 type:complete len:96 (+) Transcript_35253:183-470(+)